jgi:hypothetical protein
MYPAIHQLGPRFHGQRFPCRVPAALFICPVGPRHYRLWRAALSLSSRFNGSRLLPRAGPDCMIVGRADGNPESRLPSSPPAPVVLKRPPGLCAAPPGPASVNRGGAFLNIVSKQLQGPEGKSRRVTGQVTERTQSNTGNEKQMV